MENEIPEKNEPEKGKNSGYYPSYYNKLRRQHREPENDHINVDNRINHGSMITFKNSKYNTPARFEFSLDKGSNQVNVFD